MKAKLTLRRFFVIVAIVLGCTLVILSMATLVSANGGGTPTVDGLYTGDEANYTVLGSADGGRGTLYYNRDGDTLYLAVVVSNTVNDNVFGDKNDPQAEADFISAGWTTGSGGAKEHRFDQLENSDNVEMVLTCGSDSWTWHQGYLYQDGSEWKSDYQDNSIGGGTPPPTTTSHSSLEWNLEHVTSWDVTQGSADHKDWKSPDENPGYPGFDTTHQWEWAMVYEMSMDVSVCGSDDITISVPSAHNSPPKDGTPDVPICPDGCPLLGSIGDYVWHDEGSTLGEQDDYDVGLNDVTLELWLDNDENGQVSAEDTDMGTTTTTNDSGGNPGWYLFDGLSAGHYIVKIAEAEFDSGGTLRDYGPTEPNKTGVDDALDSDGYNPTCPYSTTTLTGECGQEEFENNILATAWLRAGSMNDLTVDFGVVAQAPPTAVTLSSFAAWPSMDDSRRWLWLGLAGVTVLVAGSFFWKKRKK